MTPGSTATSSLSVATSTTPPGQAGNTAIYRDNQSSSVAGSASTTQTTSTGGAQQSCIGGTKNHSNNVSPGATAGIAVGCAVVGALIASLVFLLMMLNSRHRRSHHHRTQASKKDPRDKRLHPDEFKDNVAVTISIPETSSAAVIQHHLPPPAEERVIVADFSKIHDKIAGHMQSYYRSNPSALDPATIESLGRILDVNAGSGSPLRSRLSTLLSDHNVRASLLRATLARIILLRVDPEANPNESFLPPEVTGLFRSMDPTDFNDRGEKFPLLYRNSQMLTILVRIAFLSKHHALTAFLLSPKYSSISSSAQTMDPADSRMIAIDSAVRLADSVFRPFSSCGTNEEEQARLRNLEEIMKRAARFGYMLVSQPTLWQFGWRTGQESLEVWPDLVQMTDDEGRVLRDGTLVGRVAAEGVRTKL